ncbi:hypothetical protein SeMB42_g03699 [Synchytrium endobioticum]|uniref:CST complex subunit STN1 n=1 Tax=Synchytrium endobioticum TaxID=286115 RepID=A0A507D4J4_9FUNG|nr:hypothetical protein SeLEV6574_g03862 [Synchytrium endobioticum]TPX46412.1 hypothetical protein SeMB42_g03699 [Synchytrium endobioticum]
MDVHGRHLDETDRATPEPVPPSTVLLGLDPLLWTHARLFVSDLLRIITKHDTLQGIWWYHTHPIKKVQVSGIVAGREERVGRYRTILLDDGTGVIPCVQWTQDTNGYTPHANRCPLSLGSLVRVRGRITEFRGSRQITVDEMFLEPNVNYEYLRWLEVVDLKQSIYDKPFQPPSNLSIHDLFNTSESDLHSVTNNLHDDGLLKHAKTMYELATKEASRPDARDDHLKEAIRWLMEVHIMGNATGSLLVEYAKIRAELMTVAENVILQQYKSDNHPITPSRINSAFGRALNSLIDEGFVYLQDVQRDVYEVIKPEQNLSAYILKILENETTKRISSLSKGKGQVGAVSSSFDGISFDIILFELRQPKCPFSRCSASGVREALRYLVGSSDVYEISPGHYKVIAL